MAAEIAEYEADSDLLPEEALLARGRASDAVRFVRAVIAARPPDAALAALDCRAEALDRRWAAVDGRLFDDVRCGIRARVYRGAALRALLARFTEAAPGTHRAFLNYDGLDLLLNGALHTAPPPGPIAPCAPEMIHYEQTPAAALLELVDRVPLGASDVLWDLGAGLGRIPILVHLLTGVATRGVEIEPAYCAYARRCASDLGLGGVSFVCADAREADYADGSVFFMFTPFVGGILDAVLRLLAQQAARRSITVCVYGPTTPTVAQQDWLCSTDGNSLDAYRLAIFRSR